MSSSYSSSSTDNIQISDIFIKCPKMMTSIKLWIGSTYELECNFKGKARSKEATLTLAPNRASLPYSTSLIVKVSQEGFLNKSKITIGRQNVLSNAGTVEADTSKREYRTIVNEIEVVIGFITLQTSGEVHDDVDLRPTTDGIFERCPRFRVLVIGRTGVGKTSLIRNTFGIKEALVSRSDVGECDINKELFSDVENKRFVSHDSKGFEPGDEDNFDTVMKFLNDREAKEDIKDQVHAVWLCFSIPVNGDRLFETGAEKFLQLLSDGQLGKSGLLDSDTFKRMVAEIVSKPEDVLSLKEMATSLSMLAAVAGIVSALSGPAAPIVLPIVATLVAGHWTVLILKQANIVLQRLMTYIVALTLIMQIIFVLTTSTENVVSRRLVKLAVKTFIHSPELEQIHSAIKQHLLEHRVPSFGRNAALQCITKLIESNRIPLDDIAKIKIEMRGVDTRVDEPW